MTRAVIDQQAEYGTIPAAARRFGLGVKLMRRWAHNRVFPVYLVDSGWHRVKYSEVEAHIRSTAASPTTHAEARVAEILDREGGEER